MPQIAKENADKNLELEPEELTKSVISDAVFTDIDSQLKKQITGDKIHFSVSEDEIKYK